MVVHAFSVSTPEAEEGGYCEFEASLVYRANSRTARTVTQKNPVSGGKKSVSKTLKTKKTTQ